MEDYTKIDELNSKILEIIGIDTKEFQKKGTPIISVNIELSASSYPSIEVSTILVKKDGETLQTLGEDITTKYELTPKGD